MAITHKTDYFAEAKSRLTQQFKGLPRIEGFLKAVSAEVQELEDAMWEVFIDRVLQSDLATDDLLAKLGALVGQGSEGLSDAQYRILIQARILANRSSGRREELITILSTLCPGMTIRAHDYYPASFYLWPMGAVPVPPILVGASFLSVAVAAGVKLIFVWNTDALANQFIFGSVDGSVDVPTINQCFASTDGAVTTGGTFAGAYQVSGS